MKYFYIIVLIIIILSTASYSTYQFSLNRQIDMASSRTDGSTVAIKSIEPVTGLAAVFSANSNNRLITWSTDSYPADIGVNINLIRKLSDSPITYEFVKNIVTNTSNDGKEIWNPSTGDLDPNLYVEVVCSDILISNRCASLSQPLQTR